MSDVETRFHETWLGLVQPTEGLVVSVPVLVDALCMSRQPAEVQENLLSLTREADDDGERTVADLPAFLERVLGHPASHFHAGDALPADLSLYVAEGRQTIRPTYGLLADPSRDTRGAGAPSPPLSQAGEGRGEGSTEAARYVALLWDVPEGLDLDRAETVTGPWDHPPSAKLDRLLRHTRIPIGILTNRRVFRLIYAPHGESSGSITFRVDHMATVGGREILDAFVMLLGATRFFSVAADRTLPALLAESRKRQANVTNDLAEQVLDAIQILLRGFERAAERDGSTLLREAVERGDDHVYGGLLTVLMRLVFVLYAEDWALLPVGSRVFGEHYSVLALYAELSADRGAYPDSMSRRYGAWSRLIALFRAVFGGVDHTTISGGVATDHGNVGQAAPAEMTSGAGPLSPHGERVGVRGERSPDNLHMPPRRGHLFDPERFPFLEGWDPSGGAPIVDAAARAAVRVPSVDDETVYLVLSRLVMYRPSGSDHGQRLSYRALDVEQLGSVYEALMGYHVEPLEHDAVALKVKAKATAARAWVEVRALLDLAPGERARHLEDSLGFDKASAKKVVEAVARAGTSLPLPDGDGRLRGAEPTATEALLDLAAGKSADRRERFRASAGRLVLQPGPERRRTSSHYTPRELSGPIVRRTLEPLLAVMGDAPASERILNLKVCDPAMGSGAFLVEACRFLADAVVAAWAREGKLPEGEDPTLAARRLVAQRCLYGVDKNAYAVDLAKLSLWLVTLAKDLPFTFLDHALRHGDSLVGLDFDQIRAGHWKPGKQLETAELALREALDEAIQIRRDILDLAADPTPEAQRLKEQKLGDADDALRHARLLADIVVGAFFAHEKDKDRERERQRRVDAFTAWKRSGDAEVPEELLEWQREIRQGSAQAQSPSPRGERAGVRGGIPVFHWMLEYPEVFYAERPDPLDENQVNRAAYMDAFVGNPPFAGKNGITEANGEGYIEWLQAIHSGAHGAADLSAHFFRRADALLGRHGSIGLIATNTIGQGDTRDTGLKPMVASGCTIFDATRSMLWPGDAAVAVSVVHLSRGNVTPAVAQRRLDGSAVRAINSRLRLGSERPDPVKLATNADLSFQGTIVLGMGFTLTPAQREELVSRDARNAERIFPYLGGEEVNTNPDQGFDRYVISFGQMTLEEAERWPDLIAIVRATVKPERDRLKDNADGLHRKQHWWQFGRSTPAMELALSAAARCVMSARVTKHLSFSFQPTDRVFAESTNVFALHTTTPLSVLQCRSHEAWARLLSSSMKNDLRYSASDCFETFPFPQPDPRTVIPELEDIGQRLYDTRARYMLDEQVGLTVTYNRLKDPTVDEPRIVELRRLHEDMDAAVLRAYGWTDIAVPPFCIATDADRRALEAFENDVIDRLFVLNAERAEQERLAGASAEKGAMKGKGGRGQASGARKGKKGTKGGSDGQGTLGGVE